MFVPSVTWQKQKLGLCISLVSVIVPDVSWKTKCYLKINFHCIYDFSVFIPGIMWQKQKLGLCIWLVSVIVPDVSWKTSVTLKINFHCIKGINFRDFANFGQLYRPKTKNYTRRWQKKHKIVKISSREN